MSDTPAPLRWGILGTGKIARIFADGLARSRTGTLAAVASRDAERAQAFARRHGAGRAHGSYDALFADDAIDVVYVATPHPTHLELGRRAAQAGKHVLCEKPMAMDEAEAGALVDAARAAGVFLMEAFAFRCHPQTARLVELVGSGAIGDVRFIEASFGYDAGPEPGNYLLRPELGGGALLDVGCYTVAMARLLAGSASGRSFADPDDVAAAAFVGPDGCDHATAGVLVLPGGIVAQLSCAVQVNLANTLTVRGTRGVITVDSPWLPGRLGEATAIVVEAGGERNEHRFELDGDANLYSLQADEVAAMVLAGEQVSPRMPWADTLGNMRTLDRWHDAIAVAYA